MEDETTVGSWGRHKVIFVAKNFWERISVIVFQRRWISISALKVRESSRTEGKGRSGACETMGRIVDLKEGLAWCEGWGASAREAGQKQVGSIETHCGRGGGEENERLVRKQDRGRRRKVMDLS